MIASPSTPVRGRRFVVAEQRALFCACGQPLPVRSPKCRRCAQAAIDSRRRFGSNRETVLARDGYRCQGCGAGEGVRLHVHHRRPGCHDSKLLVALCAACHARIHRLRANRAWLPSPVFEFWVEQHAAGPVQLQFDEGNW